MKIGVDKGANVWHTWYIMATVIDRMTINWQGEHEVEEAKRFRILVGERNINKTLKAMIREFIKRKGQP